MNDFKKIKVGVISEFNADNENYNNIQKVLSRNGYKLEFVDLPNLKYSLADLTQEKSVRIPFACSFRQTFG